MAIEYFGERNWEESAQYDIERGTQKVSRANHYIIVTKCSDLDINLQVICF